MMTTTAPTLTKEYSIVLTHLDLDFTTSNGTWGTIKEQQQVIDKQASLPLVITVDKSANKDSIYELVWDAISERSGWNVTALEVDWYSSGIDSVDVNNLSQEQMEQLYTKLHFYTRKCLDDLIQLQNEAIDDFICDELGMEDFDNELFENIVEKVSFDFVIEGFDLDAYLKRERAALRKRLANL